MRLFTFQFSVVDTDNGAQENVVVQRNIKDVHSLLGGWNCVLPKMLNSTENDYHNHSLLCSDQSSHLWRLKNVVKYSSSLLSNSSLLVFQVAQTLFMWQVLMNHFVTEFMSPNIVTFYPDLKKTAKGAYLWNKFIKLWCIRCRCRELFCSRSFIDSTVLFLFDIWYKNAIVFFI